MTPGAPGGGERRHLPLSAVNHISRVCRDVAATAAFYSDLLGFIPVQRPQSLEEKFEGCWMWRYGLGLHLIEGEPVPRSSEIDPKSDHLSFQADSLEEVAAELERRGVPFVRQTVTEGGMQVGQLFFHDPDNSMIEASRAVLLTWSGCCSWCAGCLLPRLQRGGRDAAWSVLGAASQ
ncbi:hypothetical protein COHA_008106 [Chlorella ohadii]|uniref:VOC domain-containing protein n=1 Tax=Chlorella ohadii TaxID=2649997 RepID=A0AAD5H1Y1_9CHLO|nr:hypothetical protein COHA_008106 [Chlorella ohadii]